MSYPCAERENHVLSSANRELESRAILLVDFREKIVTITLNMYHCVICRDIYITLNIKPRRRDTRALTSRAVRAKD